MLNVEAASAARPSCVFIQLSRDAPPRPHPFVSVDDSYRLALETEEPLILLFF
jgi:hypothetical protein